MHIAIILVLSIYILTTSVSLVCVLPGYPVTAIPFALRAVQLVVVYNSSSYRLTYARFVKWKNIVKLWVASGVACCILWAALFVGLRERHAMCVTAMVILYFQFPYHAKYSSFAKSSDIGSPLNFALNYIKLQEEQNTKLHGQ